MIRIETLAGAMVIGICTIAWAQQEAAPTTKPVPAADEFIAASDEPLPESLAKFRDVIDRCAKFEKRVTKTSWQQTFSEDFSEKENPQWHLAGPDNPQVVQATDEDKKSWTEYQKLDDRDVLAVIPPWSRPRLCIGPKVKGDYAIEFVGRNLPGSKCELSLFCGTEKDETGTGFRFGSGKNSENSLRVGRAGKRDIEVKLPDTPLQTDQEWHRVRLEVKDGVVAGYVNGAFIGKARLEDDYDPDVEWQPMIYACCNKIAVDEATVWSLKTEAADADRDKAWNETMGDVSLDDVAKALDELVKLLEDGDEAVRVGAARLLRESGELAIPALDAAARSGGEFEPGSVAGRLLRSIAPRYDVKLP